jgi:hypothetical protein
LVPERELAQQPFVRVVDELAEQLVQVVGCLRGRLANLAP